MSQFHGRSTRKKSGGRLRPLRKRKKHQIGGEFSEPERGERKSEIRRIRGGDEKTVVKRESHANVSTGDGVERLEIESVEENPANPNFVRRSLLTKGTVIETGKGKARVTSRPGQDGVVNAELIE